mgnify:FL=1
MCIQSVPNVTKSFNVIVEGLRDEIGVLSERKKYIQSDAKKFYVSRKRNDRTCDVHATDRGKCAAALLSSDKNCVRLVRV